MSRTFITRDDHFKEENLKNQKFSNIPEDLITEYLDLHEKLGLMEQSHHWKVEELKEAFQTKKKLILLDLENNKKKMTEMSNLDCFDLIKSKPKPVNPNFLKFQT